MNKFLVLIDGVYNPKIGGPAGYVSKLKKSCKSDEIDFCFLGQKSQPKNILLKIFDYIFLKRKFNLTFSQLFNQSFTKEKEQILINYLNDNNYQFIHCHRVEEVVFTKTLLNKLNFEIPIISTFHNPIEPSEEQFSTVEKYFGRKNAKIWQTQLKKIEKKAIDITHSFIFPCDESIEYYYSNWKYFSDKIKFKSVHYLLTGTQNQTYSIDKQKIIDQYNIPEGSIIISYVGRQIKVKGFDLLASAAELILKKHNNVYFLIGGKKGPLKGISHNNWIEIGWTNDPGSLINCSDFFILPNRQTFFDLVLLEVMSLSKPVLASSTGGNKKVSNLSKGVILFNPSVSDLFTAIEKLIILNKSALSDLGMKNFFSYKDNFTIDIFCENYIKTLNIISNEIEKN